MARFGVGYDAVDVRACTGADVLVTITVGAVDRPVGELDNVVLAPHSIAWTDELFRDIGRAACQVMMDLSLGTKPRGAVNPEVFDRPGFKAKWKRLRTPNDTRLHK